MIRRDLLAGRRGGRPQVISALAAAALAAPSEPRLSPPLPSPPSLLDLPPAPLPGARSLAKRALGWALFAVLFTWPVLPRIHQVLIGDPEVDVWNHAWGYWWVAQALGEGTLPYHTALLGAPDGGKLYVVDLVGALLATPLTWLFGAGPTYNLVLMGRIAAAGLSAQLLCEELLWRGEEKEGEQARFAGGVLAGLAYASSPFLLCELSNGISEVCNLHWVALTLLVTVRALRGGGARRWALLGLVAALTTVASFYYGLLAAILAGLLTVGRLWTRRGQARSLLGGVLLAGAVSLAVAGPFMLAFRASFEGSDALLDRPPETSEMMLLHNAVDPLVYVRPGHFVSVDLSNMDEHLLNTGYLRWSVLWFAAAALGLRRGLWGWAAVGGASLILGLGEFAYTGGEIVTVGGQPVLLPFAALRAVLPKLAITHPLRLSLGAQVVAATLAGVGLAEAARRLRLPALPMAAAAGLVVVAEGAFGSTGPWPLPLSDARIPDIYADLDPRPILDLPAEVGGGMRSSRHLWFQTRHGHPVPYVPDVRVWRTRDPLTFSAFSDSDRRERPGALTEEAVTHIWRTYAAVIVHTDLEELTDKARYRPLLEPWFGAPEEHGSQLVWRMR